MMLKIIIFITKFIISKLAVFLILLLVILIKVNLFKLHLRLFLLLFRKKKTSNKINRVIINSAFKEILSFSKNWEVIRYLNIIIKQIWDSVLKISREIRKVMN
jgi:hypothetical protein